MAVRIERIYEALEHPGWFRVLVDRVWPRGVSKERAHLDAWCKDIAPSTELRQWFGHVPARFAEFRRRYMAELSANPATPEFEQLVKAHPDTVLLYSAKDETHNQAVVYIQRET